MIIIMQYSIANNGLSAGKSCDGHHLQGCYHKAMFLYSAAQKSKEASEQVRVPTYRRTLLVNVCISY